MSSVSSEKLLSEVQSLEVSWKKHSGSLAGHKVTMLQASELVEVRGIQEQAKELFRSIRDMEKSGASEQQLSGLREAQKRLTTLYHALTETLLSARADEILEKTTGIASLNISEIEDLYEICLGLKRDLEEARGVLQDQAPAALLRVEFLVSKAVDDVKKNLSDKKEEENMRKTRGMVSSPKALAIQGKEAMLAGYIRTGGELHRLEGMEPVYGPVNITPQTKILEKLIKALLLDMDTVRFTKDPSGVFMVTFDRQTYNFSDIMAKANFNHLNLEFEGERNNFLDRYHELQEDKAFRFSPLFEGPSEFIKATKELFDARDPTGMYKNLTLAEKEAINVYTGDANWFMIRLLSGNIMGAVEAFEKKSTAFPSTFSEDQKIDIVVKEGLLHSAVCIFALNKLPDYTPSPRDDGSVPRYLYRCEALNEKAISEKTQLVADGGSTSIFQFMSTSHTEATYSNGNVFILVENAKGKQVEAITQFQFEKEVLLPPTQVQWLYHREDVATKTHFYIVRPITAPSEMPVH